MFYTDRNSCDSGPCKSTQTLPVPSVCETTCFITNTRTIILFTNTTLNRLGFGGTAIEHFHFRNNETEPDWHVGEPKQSCGSWTLFLCKHFRWVYVAHFAHRNLGQPSKTTHILRWYIQQKAALVLVEEKRVHNNQSNYSFVFIRKVVHISWRQLQVCKVNKSR